ncbi:MAG: ABC transporter permease [Ignavibacteria bacterium CG_4_8_14_3_um_filter_37_9]|nr:ABC transporter permease [Ignavibacteria bacterium]OIO16636.1 MAG: ABC transporter permease [Ignavibacteria bacterium CG1_02_37_35]PIP76214.1 MAG: ABC transporter permease [Ignavibacteria bacterium CG22_combo_CG10-13_8_21_14_all_37_15]PIS45942.1 MAG: ABC transporter permease [Ignavibacteria bacterium CG08_land_8_20_14_0_20_37_9]PIW98981.1 MAG: ABC transporter permease [Ignavibacteria bacterium CG_4_8_14_3_um_filter_37_9]PIX95333.1 MAG: ABC transporter permease [Ignavibacteria bacterium CG_4
MYNSITGFLLGVGQLFEFCFRFLKNVFLPPYEFHEIKKHMDELGVKTLPIVSVTGFIIGVVLAMQSEPILARFGAESVLPAMVSLSVVRELGPVITALIFAGRVSSGIGAELGSMRVTEQIDAMEVSAIDPFRYLVVTRVVACSFILPVLTLYVVFLAIFGGYLAMILSQGMSLQLYVVSVVEAIRFGDIIPGIGKTFFFGFIVGIVGAFKGYNADKGTEGVGKASTTSVVLSSLLILVTDTVLVKITLWIWP